MPNPFHADEMIDAVMHTPIGTQGVAPWIASTARQLGDRTDPQGREPKEFLVPEPDNIIIPPEATPPLSALGGAVTASRASSFKPPRPVSREVAHGYHGTRAIANLSPLMVTNPGHRLDAESVGSEAANQTHHAVVEFTHY